VERKVSEAGDDFTSIDKRDTPAITGFWDHLEDSTTEQEVQRQMEIAGKMMSENRNLLHKLAQWIRPSS
jgi:hypothetical protein